MLISRGALSALMTACACLVGVSAADAASAAKPARSPQLAAAQTLSAETLEMARWVAHSHDNRGMPFAIVDKQAARAFMFTSRGRLVGATAVLLGSARGDHSVPGVGELPPSRIPADARTTPAGRFVSGPGTNLDGEEVVWFDYNAGLAIHRLRADAAHASRLHRLKSDIPASRRVSAGCVVVPVAFYKEVVQPLLGQGRGVLYVLPELRPLEDVFTELRDD